jgi:pyridoxamine 5'-phosphate oxidase
VSPAPDAFDERSVDPDPFLQFAAWYADAEIATDAKAAAMVIATSTADGRPSARVVLLRGFDERGFVFFTNYESR